MLLVQMGRVYRRPPPVPQEAGHIERLSGGAWPRAPQREGNLTDADIFHHRHWKPLPNKAGLPDVRLHDLRQTCATLLLTRCVHPKIVSEMLGRSSIAITRGTYSHVLPGMQQAAAHAMEDILGE